ncbi:MAG: hypothetical protein WCZ43_11175 [Proteiniphilum sp.]
MKINFIETASVFIGNRTYVTVAPFVPLSINQATYFDIIEEIAVGRR